MKAYANTPDQLRARLELRRSGAAGKHADKRGKRARTRQAQFARAAKDFS
jgi:hypothetical protein